LSGGKAGTIDFVKGSVDSMKKGKNGHFCVVSKTIIYTDTYLC